MAIADDWDFNYSAKVLSHIDGILSYDTGAGRQAVVGEYIIQNAGATNQAVGKILAVTGNTTSGTLTLTNVVGLFEDNVAIEVMSELGFDGLTDYTPALQGVNPDDTISGQTGGSTFVVRVIEYNDSGQTLGAGGGGGTFYGTAFSAVFTNNELLDNDTTGQVDIGDADGVGVDNDAALTTTLANGTLAEPGTANENNSVIVHYDAGAIAIPEQAVINDGTTGATGLVEEVTGVLGTGSVRIVDYNQTGGVYTNDNALVLQQVVNYDLQVAGQVFSVGDIVEANPGAATGRVLAVIDDGDSTGRLILADESGTWDEIAPDSIEVGGVKIAEVENNTFILSAATINIPDGLRQKQAPKSNGGSVAQGGIFLEANGLNIRRKSNSLYTLSQDTFDELVQLDDDEALDATVKGGAYQIVFDWEIPDLSFRFLRQGGWGDTNGQNTWANPQTVGAQNKITDTAFLYVAAQTFQMPQLYIEQNGVKIEPHWLEGNIDVLVKVKSWGDTTIIDPSTPGLGKLFPGGDPQVDGSYAVFNREFYTSTYDATEFAAAAGGVNTVAMGTQSDSASDRNPQGTHTMGWDGGSAATLLVGESFYTAPVSENDVKWGIVVAQTGDATAAGTVEYVLKSGTQFADGDVLVGEVSGKAFTVDETGGFGAANDVVAGFGVDIRFQVVDIEAVAITGTGITGKFVHGDLVTQAVTAATGYLVYADTTTDRLYIETVTGTFSGDNDITGSVTGSWDAGVGATFLTDTSFPFDLNNGEGAFEYCGTASGDITDAAAETMQNVYQFSKYLARQEEETYIFNGPGTADLGTIGRFFRKLSDAFSEVKPGNPVGVYTGSLAYGQGWVLDTDFIAAANIRDFSVVDHTGATHSPPNLQSLIVSGVSTGWRVAAYRSTGAASTLILRTEFDVGVVGSGNNQQADLTILVGAQDRTISPLPSDVPDAGVLRVLSPNNTGNYIRFTYDSVDRATNIFTLSAAISTFFTAQGETAADLTLDDNVHVVFIEEQASGATATNTVQYVADIDLVYKARLKGFKPFRSTGIFTSAGVTLGVVQTADSIVDLP